MDLTPGQQRLLFVVIVLVLVVLGVFLVRSHNSGTSATPAPTASVTATATATGSPGAAASAGPADTPPATVPAATPLPTTGPAAIYQWLPFTQAELTSAAQTTLAFAKAYVTWSYSENKAAYAARLSPLVTSTELTTLESGYSTSGLSVQRVAAKQVSTGSGAISSIKSFAAGTITFVVDITQQVASTSPTQTVTTENAVTVDGAGASWQVDNIELSSLGNP